MNESRTPQIFLTISISARFPANFNRNTGWRKGAPIDLIPDFISILGVLDDLVLIPLGFMLVIRLIPAELLAECRRSAKTAKKAAVAGKVAAVVIVLLWILAALLLVRFAVRILNIP